MQTKIVIIDSDLTNSKFVQISSNPFQITLENSIPERNVQARVLPQNYTASSRQYKDTQLFFGHDGSGFFKRNPPQKEQLYFGTDGSGFFKITAAVKKEENETTCLLPQIYQPHNYSVDFEEFHKFHNKNHEPGYIL